MVRQIHFLFILTIVVIVSTKKCAKENSTTVPSAVNDKTYHSKAVGEEVVDAVIEKIHKSKIFADDKQFLRRIACAESKFGKDTNTFRSGYYGGIWQVDLAGFEDTQNVEAHKSKLIEKHAKVWKEFKINWMDVTYKDLVIPLYSGLAARLLISNKDPPIPESLIDQGAYWKKYYNSEKGSGTAEGFVNHVNHCEISKCKGKLNIVVVLDGSGSVGIDQFNITKKAIAVFLSTFSLKSARIGFIVYSGTATTIISLQNTFKSSAELSKKITEAVYPSSGTRTDLGIRSATEMFAQLDEDSNRGIPKLIMVFTDGKSNHDPKAESDKARLQHLTIYAFGIGSNINGVELKKISGDEERTFQFNTFSVLKEKAYYFNQLACKFPQQPIVNATMQGTLFKDDSIYIKYFLPKEGLTVKLETTIGQAEAYYSYNVQNPSSALNDGVITSNSFIPPVNNNNNCRRKRSVDIVDDDDSQVFIAVKGIDETNNYTLSALEGDHSYKGMPAYAWILIIVGGVIFLAGTAYTGHTFMKNRNIYAALRRN